MRLVLQRFRHFAVRPHGMFVSGVAKVAGQPARVLENQPPKSS